MERTAAIKQLIWIFSHLAITLIIFWAFVMFLSARLAENYTQQVSLIHHEYVAMCLLMFQANYVQNCISIMSTCSPISQLAIFVVNKVAPRPYLNQIFGQHLSRRIILFHFRWVEAINHILLISKKGA